MSVEAPHYVLHLPWRVQLLQSTVPKKKNKEDYHDVSEQQKMEALNHIKPGSINVTCPKPTYVE